MDTPLYTHAHEETHAQEEFARPLIIVMWFPKTYTMVFMSHNQNHQEIRLPVVHKITHALTEAKDRFGLNYESFLLNSKGGGGTRAINSY